MEENRDCPYWSFRANENGLAALDPRSARDLVV
jgi:hypothetical protein